MLTAQPHRTLSQQTPLFKDQRRQSAKLIQLFTLSEELFDLPSSVVKKKVHFSGESKENIMRGENSESQLTSKSKCKDLKKRLHAAQLRAQALSDIEKTYQLKSRQILGMR